MVLVGARLWKPLVDFAVRTPSRIHHIAQPDNDRHLHDHPWNARTIILNGGYIEEILLPDGTTQLCVRRTGYTGRIGFGMYHRIVSVEPFTVTLFITDNKQGEWGYLVDGKKVPYYEYHAGGELA